MEPEPQFGFAALWSWSRKKYFRLHNTNLQQLFLTSEYTDCTVILNRIAIDSISVRLATISLQGKSHLCIPFLGIARPESQFPHSCVCERFLYSQISPHNWLQQNIQNILRNIPVNISQIYECIGIGRENFI
jgi:hypothetical protein